MCVHVQAKLLANAKKESEVHAKLAAASTRMIALRGEECGVRLAATAATWQLLEARNGLADLDKAITDKKAEVTAADAEAATAKTAHATKHAEARRAAPQFEKDKATGERSAAAQSEWEALPGGLDELDVEIDRLEEEIANSDDDDGKTLRDYEARLKDIAASKTKVAGTQGEITSKQSTLDDLVAEWKPNLEQLIQASRTLRDRHHVDVAERLRVGRRRVLLSRCDDRTSRASGSGVACRWSMTTSPSISRASSASVRLACATDARSTQ